jgi:uncharacterized RDD family membrane protein YckC
MPPVLPQPLAERGTRLLAASIDELILLAIALPMIAGAVPSLLSLAGTDPASIGTAAVIEALMHGPGMKLSLAGFACWCAVTAWLVTNSGQSIGKRTVGIKVVRPDGSRASFTRIFLLRNVLNGVPSAFPALGLVYQLVDPLFIFQQSRRCLHDLIADTIVVRCGHRARAGGS